jgi:hypothetical protein
MSKIDLNNIIDVFIITNGRSTFPYCIKSVESQIGVKFNLAIIRDMEWQAAHERILKKCKSKFALRVDDDMLLHPMALRFMYECVKDQNDRIALRGWRLWEPWSNKVCKGIKVYNYKAAKKIGFKLDHLGKIDKPFTKNAEKAGYKIKYTRDVVAIHSCGDFEEHLKYWEMRGEAKDGRKTEKRIWAENLIKSCHMNLQEQYDLNKKFIKDYNIEKGYDFGKFI